MQKQRLRPRMLLLIGLLFPISLSCCCVWLTGSSIIEGALIHNVLIFGGQATPGSIDAILPCQSDSTIASDPAGGFSLGATGTDEYGEKIGEPEKGAETVRVRYSDADGHEQLWQTVACTLLSPDMGIGSHVDIRVRPEAPQDILLEKDLGVYRTIAASAWTVTGILVLCIVSFWRDVHGKLKAWGNR